MYHKTRQYRRAARKTAIAHKSEIARINQWYAGCLTPKVLGMMNKGKVHCSCPLCSAKTARDGYKFSDKQKLIHLDQSESDIA